MADRARAAAPHQVHVDVVVVIDVRAGREHGREVLAGRRLHVAQEALLLRSAAPAVLDRDLAAVGERERCDVERIAERVLGDFRSALAVHAAARIGGDLPDLGDLHAEPLHRRRLHAAGKPAVERGHDRAGERRGRLHRDRTGRDRPALAPERYLLGGRIGLLRVDLRRVGLLRLLLRIGLRRCAACARPARAHSGTG